jgi:hypothetical protein
MDFLTRLNGKQRWLEKSPEHVHFLKQILQLWPTAPIIELVRDPRATLASRKIRREDDLWLHEKEWREGVAADHSTNYDPLLDTLMWREAIHAAAGARRIYPQHILTLRYEDLAADPEATIRRTCAFTGLSFRPEMLAVSWVNSTTQRNENSPVTGGVSTAAVERWRSVLLPEEIYLCQRLAHKEMEQLGYSLTTLPLAVRLKAPAMLGRSALHFYSRARGRRTAQLALRARETSDRMLRNALKQLGLQK